MLTRRRFLAGAGVAALARVSPVRAARYDMLVKGGRVIDPAQHIDRVADVAIQGGRVRAIRPDIAAADAADVIDAGGKLVTPGLIDLHVHVGAPDLTPATLLRDGVTTWSTGIAGPTTSTRWSSCGPRPIACASS
jgi:dihydroorotase